MERSGFQLPFNPVTGAVLDNQEIPIQIHKSRFSALSLALRQYLKETYWRGRVEFWSAHASSHRAATVALRRDKLQEARLHEGRSKLLMTTSMCSLCCNRAFELRRWEHSCPSKTQL
jgi:hypothetical protein